MRRRQGFTLIELLVVMGLILLIMVILAEAFAISLNTLRRAKAVGDMEEKLRSATTMLRRDLMADHFEGRRKLSDRTFYVQGPPREGFFRLCPSQEPNFSTSEGNDADGVASLRRVNRTLHFTVKLRGNDREQFFSANVPPGSPLLGAVPTTFFDQPADARFQDQPNTYSSQWAEVCYFLRYNNTNAGNVRLYNLYRSQLAVVADNRGLNWPPIISAGLISQYQEMSCRVNGASLYFPSPTDLSDPANRCFNPGNPDVNRAQQILSDVISFDVQIIPYFYRRSEWYYKPQIILEDIPDHDTNNGETISPLKSQTQQPYFHYVIQALQITLRIWDLKTQQTRQITIIQDM